MCVFQDNVATDENKIRVGIEAIGAPDPEVACEDICAKYVGVEKQGSRSELQVMNDLGVRLFDSSGIGNIPAPTVVVPRLRLAFEPRGIPRRNTCGRVRSTWRSSPGCSRFWRLSHAAFHLEPDQPVHFHRVLHRQLLNERLDESRHDHRGGFGLALIPRLIRYRSCSSAIFETDASCSIATFS